MLKALLLALTLLAPTSNAAEIFTAPPGAPDPAKTYVFYLHGKIVEAERCVRRHSSFGVYGHAVED